MTTSVTSKNIVTNKDVTVDRQQQPVKKVIQEVTQPINKSHHQQSQPQQQTTHHRQSNEQQQNIIKKEDKAIN